MLLMLVLVLFVSESWWDQIPLLQQAMLHGKRSKPLETKPMSTVTTYADQLHQLNGSGVWLGMCCPIIVVVWNLTPSKHCCSSRSIRVSGMCQRLMLQSKHWEQNVQRQKSRSKKSRSERRRRGRGRHNIRARVETSSYCITYRNIFAYYCGILQNMHFYCKAQTISNMFWSWCQFFQYLGIY